MSTGTEACLRRLVAATAAYLGRFDGPGLEEVRAGIAEWEGGPVRQAEPRRPAALTHLTPALDAVARTGEAELAAAIAGMAPHLGWTVYDLYPREMIGAGFADGHAYARLIGVDAPIAVEDFELGLFLISPHVFYRDHRHAAPELYAPLTGPHGWRFRPGDPLSLKPAHAPVWNEPWRPHATKVGPKPFLCLYCWTRDVSLPAEVLPSDDWAMLESASLEKATHADAQ